jgi:hypothetical protein
MLLRTYAADTSSAISAVAPEQSTRMEGPEPLRQAPSR